MAFFTDDLVTHIISADAFIEIDDKDSHTSHRTLNICLVNRRRRKKIASVDIFFLLFSLLQIKTQNFQSLSKAAPPLCRLFFFFFILFRQINIAQ